MALLELPFDRLWGSHVFISIFIYLLVCLFVVVYLNRHAFFTLFPVHVQLSRLLLTLCTPTRFSVVIMSLPSFSNLLCVQYLERIEAYCMCSVFSQAFTVTSAKPRPRPILNKPLEYVAHYSDNKFQIKPTETTYIAINFTLTPYRKMSLLVS